MTPPRGGRGEGALRRIAVVTHEFSPFRGGIGRVAEGIATGAAQEGWDVTVVAPDYGADRREEDARRPFRVHRFPGRHCSVASQRKLFRYAWQLRQILPGLDADLIHALCPATQMALTSLSWIGGVPAPMAFTVHGTELLRYRGELVPRLWMRGAFRRPLGVVAVSGVVQEHLRRHFRVPEGVSVVSHPGIADVWHDHPFTDRAGTRGDWGAAPDDVVVLTVARRVREKGHDRVVRGIARLAPEERRGMLYVVAGTGPDAWARELRELAAEHGVRLRLLDEVPDTALVAACDAADVFAMLSRETPTRLEGLGLTYLEAGRRGLPSVAVDTGGVREAVLDGRTGLVLDGDSGAEAVGDALGRLGRDAALRQRLGANARERVALFTDRRHAREVYGAMKARLPRGRSGPATR